MTKRLLAAALPVAALALLAGCGSDGETVSDPGTSSSSATSSATQASSASSSAPSAKAGSAPGLPDCTDTWVKGKVLPASYKGCQEGGVKDASYIYHCEVGSKLATYGERFYAVPGRRIVEAVPSRAEDKDWKFTFSHCTG